MKNNYANIFSVLLLAMAVCFQSGCGGDNADKKEKQTKKDEHSHADGDELHWPKKDVEKNGYMISLGHHGNHFHGGEKIEPAVAITKDGKDIGDAKLSCILMDGDTPSGSSVDMVFEPKTAEEPAHYAGGKLTFPKEEKKYKIQFEILFAGQAEPLVDSIEVLCGH